MPNLPFRTNKKWIISVLIVAFSCILLYFILLNFHTYLKFLDQVMTILQPILIGVLLAYLISPVCARLENVLGSFFEKKVQNKERAKHFAKLLSVAISVLLILLIVFALFSLIIPQLIESIREVIVESSENEDNIRAYLDRLFTDNPQNQAFILGLYNNISDWLLHYLNTSVIPNLNNMVSILSQHILALMKLVFNFFIGIIVSAYCLSRRREFGLQAKKLLFALTPNIQVAEYLLGKARLINVTFLGFFTGKLIDSFLIGILCFIGTTLLQIPHSILVSVIIGVTNVIPFFGPFIGAVPTTFIILLANPLKALYFLIFIFLLQQFDGNILGPRILGSSTGLSSFWVLFSILLFGGLWGVTGMIVAVPLFAVIYTLIKEFLDERLRKKNLPIVAYAYENADEIKTEESEQK